jgi:hypothetical protein
VLLNDKIYVGVGCTSKGTENRIFVSTTQLDRWQSYSTPSSYYALTVFDSQLTLVGGIFTLKIFTNKIWMSSTGTEWLERLPPMPTERCFSSAVSTKNSTSLIVAGGSGYVDSYKQVSRDIGNLKTVEVYKEEQWFTVEDLPRPCCNMKLAVHKDILYLMGGSEQGLCVYSLRLDFLLLRTPRSMWNTSLSVPLAATCPVIFGDHLVTVGGLEPPSSAIHSYFNRMQTWEVIGDLPIEVIDAAALELPSGEIVVIGGLSHTTRSDKVYKSSVTGMCIVSPYVQIFLISYSYSSTI